jgi:hypothetical protein
MQMRRFRLERASVADTKWLCNLLNLLGEQFSTSAQMNDDNSLMVTWQRE